MWFPVLIFKTEIIYTFLANGATSLLEVLSSCHLSFTFCSSLFIEVDGNNVSVNFCFCLYIKYSSFKRHSVYYLDVYEGKQLS